MARQVDSTTQHVTKVLLDLIAFFIAANLAFDLRYHVDWQALLGQVVKGGTAPWAALYQAMPYMLLGLYLINEIFGLYRSSLRPREESTLIIKAQLFAFGILFAVAFFYRGFSYSRFAALFLVPISMFLSLSFRTLYRVCKRHLLKKMSAVREKVLVVGQSDVAENLVKKLQDKENQYEIAGILAGERQLSEDKHDEKVLGSSRQLGVLLTRKDVDRVLMVSGALSHDEITHAIETCYRHRVPWGVVPDLYDLLVDRLHMEQIAGITIMGPLGSKIVGMNLVFKRLVDISAALMLLFILSPFMIMMAVAIKITSKGPVFYRQKRVGRGGRPFIFYKYRSMYCHSRDKQHRVLMERVIKNGSAAEHDKNGAIFKSKRDPRITPVGRIIRMFSVDELPQLFNVIRGDMSLVGPRPAIPYEVRHYGDRHLRRLDTLPGITGLWQVSGRNRLSFEQMVDLDIHYIENWSVGLDVRILVKTISAVLFGRGL